MAEEKHHKHSSASQTEPPPSLVTLKTPSFSPSPRRLSSRYSQPRSPIKAARQLAWVSLQGRLVNADEATSAITVGGCGGLGPKEAVAWELFTPMHRVLTVAVVAAAASNSKKDNQIFQLNKSVELRDQVLSSMQQKLDHLCEQLSYLKDQPATGVDSSACQRCQDHNKHQTNDWMANAIVKISNDHQTEEPEERRMSDLSDGAPSVASSIEFQLNTSATEQQVYDLRRECEEKDATLKELATFIDSSEAFGAKRIAELEDIIRRKNTIITRLKKDIVILEQKVMNLSRLRRPSFAGVKSSERPVPLMTDNLLYDMDSSTTSPSSSDTDNSSENTAPRIPTAAIVGDSLVQNVETASKAGSHRRRQNKPSVSRALTPLKEKKSLHQTPESVAPPSLTPKQTSYASGGGDSRSRRRPPARSKDGGGNAIQQKRRV